ncbi:MAG: hypothetical protein IPI49_19445 [Myxococcales bacterium]|nr:hypothetical protein [Myxococcales bacterium]
MKKHTLTLGRNAGGAGVPSDLLVEGVGALLEGARRATLFFFEGASSGPGARPAWLEAACRVEITALRSSTYELELHAPTLAEAVPERFGAVDRVAHVVDPMRTVSAADTAVDLFGCVLVDAIHGAGERLWVDLPLLDSCVRFARVAQAGLGAIELSAGEPPATIAVDADDYVRLEALRAQASRSTAVRVVGILQDVSAVTPTAALLVGEDAAVAVHFDASDRVRWGDLLGGRVLISGRARFLPSGKVLVIEAEYIAPAQVSDELFASLPRSLDQPVATQREHATSRRSTFFPTWPGTETDEELLAELKRIR